MTINFNEEFYSDEGLASHTLDDVDEPERNTTPDNWSFVRARDSTRGVGMYSEGLYRVTSKTSGKPITSEVTETVDIDTLVDRMPSSPRKRKAIPSIRGEYLTIKEVRGSENADGTISVETIGRTSVIPVEYVLEPLSYNYVVAELVDEEL
jgi:hypothetical protein